MLRTRMSLAGAAISALLGTLLLGGCPPVTSNPTDPNGNPTSTGGKPALRPFASGDELLRYFRNQVTTRTSQRSGWDLGFLAAAGGAANDAATTGAPAAEGGGGSFSTTNLQEQEVDESDVFKSDGTYFYIGKGRSLRIVKAAPVGELAQVGRIDLDHEIDSLYLFEGRILVLSHKYGTGDVTPAGPQADIMIWPPYYRNASVVVQEIDVTDPTVPVIVAKNEIDGSLVTSRLTGGRLVLVLTVTPTLPENPTPLALARLGLVDVLPQRRTAGAAAPVVAVENWYRPETPWGYNSTVIVTLDAANVETVLGSLGVLANVETVYASTEAVYIASGEYVSNAGKSYYRTLVHKFSFDESGVARYTASGALPGSLLNQFSLSESAGYLRAATHIQMFNFIWEEDFNAADSVVSVTQVTPGGSLASAPPQPFNAVYVLAEADGVLTIVGSIEDIAPGERLFAARFVGERAYLVTFEQIDPLFTVDLSNPTAPAILGELKIPGYSDYLHPYGENLLIGVGRSTAELPWGGVVANALQLSLFNVSDPLNPTVVQQIEVGGYGSSSDVSYTHKAFTFLADRGLLALPATLMTRTSSARSGAINLGFDGVLCYQVTPTGFAELGRLESVSATGYWGWGGSWRRAAFIGDMVYALTDAGVRAAALTDFTATTTLDLPPNEGDQGWAGPPWSEGPAWMGRPWW